MPTPEVKENFPVGIGTGRPPVGQKGRGYHSIINVDLPSQASVVGSILTKSHVHMLERVLELRSLFRPTHCCLSRISSMAEYQPKSLWAGSPNSLLESHSSHSPNLSPVDNWGWVIPSCRGLSSIGYLASLVSTH